MSRGREVSAYARKLASQLAPFLIDSHYAISQNDLKLNKWNQQIKKEHIIAYPSPQQTNSYDCGVYVIAVSKFLSQCVVDGQDIHSDQVKNAMIETLTPAKIEGEREKIREFIRQVQSQTKST